MKFKKDIKKIMIISLLCSFGMWKFMYSQDFSQAKSAIKMYINEWFAGGEEKEREWIIEVNGFQFPKEGIEFGLKILDENLKKGKISDAERLQIRERYIQTYIDQSTILALTYEDLLKNPELDLLLQEFLRQAATQIWLEKQMEKDPKAAEPTQAEIDSYFQQNSERLIRLGLSASQIKNYTEQELRQAKLQQWTFNQLQTIKNISDVKINPAMMKKLGMKNKK